MKHLTTNKESRILERGLLLPLKWANNIYSNKSQLTSNYLLISQTHSKRRATNFASARNPPSPTSESFCTIK